MNKIFFNHKNNSGTMQIRIKRNNQSLVFNHKQQNATNNNKINMLKNQLNQHQHQIIENQPEKSQLLSPCIYRLDKQIQNRSRKKCRSNHSQKQVLKICTNMKKIPLSSVNIFEQNQQLAFLQQSQAFFTNPNFNTMNDYSRTFKSLSASKKLFRQSRQSRVISQTTKAKKTHQDYMNRQLRNKKIIYTRSNRKRDNSFKKYNQTIGLSIGKKEIAKRPQTSRVRSLESHPDNQKPMYSMIRSKVNIRILLTSEKKQGSTTKILKKTKKFKNSPVKIQLPKKSSAITPWD